MPEFTGLGEDDRKVCRELVEDFWRARFAALQKGDLKLATEIGSLFDQRIETVAATLPPSDAAAFLQAFEAERTAILDEYDADPIALKRRLGVPLGVDAPRSTYSPPGGSGWGGLIARTTVRATIWEGIRYLFFRR